MFPFQNGFWEIDIENKKKTVLDKVKETDYCLIQIKNLLIKLTLKTPFCIY